MTELFLAASPAFIAARSFSAFTGSAHRALMASERRFRPSSLPADALAAARIFATYSGSAQHSFLWRARFSACFALVSGLRAASVDLERCKATNSGSWYKARTPAICLALAPGLLAPASRAALISSFRSSLREAQAALCFSDIACRYSGVQRALRMAECAARFSGVYAAFTATDCLPRVSVDGARPLAPEVANGAML